MTINSLSNLVNTTDFSAETGEIPAGPWVLRHPGFFFFLFFFFSSLTWTPPARAFVRDISMGGGALIGESSMGTILVNVRSPFTNAGQWGVFWNADVKLLFPLKSNMGASIGPGVSLEYKNSRWSPFVTLTTSYAYVDGHHGVFEATTGFSVELKEFQGLRLYAGWNTLGMRGVIVGALIYLAW